MALQFTKLTVIGLGLIPFVSGCRTAISTHVVPDPEGGWATKKIRGIPVTVNVPTHLEIRVTERRYYQPGGKFEPVKDVNCNPVFSRHICEEVKEKAQLVFVDTVRPGAGTLAMGAGFSNDKNKQFFSSYDSNIDDQTINTIAALIPGIEPVLANLKKARAVAGEATTPAPADMAMAFTEHLVAVKLFDVNDPCLTDAVRQFVSQNMNCRTVCPPQ
jgi:hypothetical protein